MPRSRTNGITGETIRLFSYFYKNDLFKDPSSLGNVKLTNLSNHVITSVLASDIRDWGSGIKSIEVELNDSFVKGRYKDIWTNVVYDSGDTAESKVFEFVVRDEEWVADDTFHPSNYNINVTSPETFKLYEKKWISFNIKEAQGNLPNTDSVSLLFKDFNGSNVYVSSVAVNDYLNAYYYFNTSSLQADFPDDINRENTYEWVLRIEYNNQIYQPDPVLFKFSQV
jgi:hypothetical protein